MARVSTWSVSSHICPSLPISSSVSRSLALSFLSTFQIKDFLIATSVLPLAKDLSTNCHGQMGIEIVFWSVFTRLCDWSDSESLKITGKAVILEIFWSGSETSVLLTKPVNMLLEWTIYSHKQKCKSNDVSRINLQMNSLGKEQLALIHRLCAFGLKYSKLHLCMYKLNCMSPYHIAAAIHR